MKVFFDRYGRAIVGATLCVGVCLGTIFLGGFNRPVQGAEALSGKWTGNIAWASASGREYNRTLHTALIFQPDHTLWTVLSLPSGAIGGTGTYALKDGHLTIHCTSMNINSRALPQKMFANQPWYHATATYSATFDGSNLTLVGLPAHAGGSSRVSAPAYPLLVTGKPIVLSRVESPDIRDQPAPKE